MTRRLKNGIISEIIKYTADTEVPGIFALWTGISIVSASLGRNTFIDQGHFTVYPNMYIVLVAASARCRKSTAVNIASFFLEQIDPPINLLSQKQTPEALIGTLSGVDVDNQKIVQTATGIAVVDELSTLIDKNSFANGMIAILTKLYDCKDFDYRTKGRGLEAVRNPCLSILGGSTLQWIKEAIPVVSIGGGFTSRIVFVFQEKREKDVAWPIMSEENKKRGEDIAADLNYIAHNMRGSFAMSADALDLYKIEYARFNKDSDLFDNPNLSGYSGRRHITLLKIAMCLSASIKDSREIDVQDMKAAINSISLAERHMPRILNAINSEACGDICEQVLTTIMNKGKIDRPTLIRMFKHKLTSQQLDVIMQTLIECRAVNLNIVGSVQHYTVVEVK